MFRLGAFTRALRISAALAMGAMTAPAQAQDADAPEVQCLRFVQSYEHANQIPLGLLTAISFVEAGRPGADGKVVAWPWTTNVGGESHYYDTKEQAVAETQKLLSEGARSIDVGCMQINLRYHPTAFKSLDEAFDPATNVAYATKFLKSLHDLQGSWPKAIERYHSAAENQKADYREKVMAFWNNDARQMMLDAVMAENTNTIYHRAIRSYVEGHYADALDSYENIVDANDTDRIGLLGLAMSFEKLEKVPEARQAYIRYLAVEPSNDSVAAHVLRDLLSIPGDDGRQALANAIKQGVKRPEYLSALSERSTAAGDIETARQYALAAVQAAPEVAAYNLNAAVLADRLNHRSVAINYYTRFLALSAENPAWVDASIGTVRERLKYLQLHS